MGKSDLELIAENIKTLADDAARVAKTEDRKEFAEGVQMMSGMLKNFNMILGDLVAGGEKAENARAWLEIGVALVAANCSEEPPAPKEGELHIDLLGESDRKHSHYFKDVSGLDRIDVYRVLQLFGVTDPCLQHAIKKLLVAGGRGHKDIDSDVSEAIDTLERWVEMREEDDLPDLSDVTDLGVSQRDELCKKAAGHEACGVGVD